MTCVRNHHLVVFFLWCFCFLFLLFLPRCSSMCSYFIVHRFSCRYISFGLKKRSKLVLSLVISFQKGIPFHLLYLSFILWYTNSWGYMLFLNDQPQRTLNAFVTIIFFFMSYPFFLIINFIVLSGHFLSPFSVQKVKTNSDYQVAQETCTSQPSWDVFCSWPVSWIMPQETKPHFFSSMYIFIHWLCFSSPHL